MGCFCRIDGITQRNKNQEWGHFPSSNVLVVTSCLAKSKQGTYALLWLRPTLFRF